MPLKYDDNLEWLKRCTEETERRLNAPRRSWEIHHRAQEVLKRLSGVPVDGGPPVARPVVLGLPVAQPIAVGWLAARNVFCKSGCVWKVVFDGNPEFSIKATLGAGYLDYLLHHPNKLISAFDLEVAVNPEKEAARAKDSIQERTDPEAAKQYLRDLDRLRAKSDVAQANGDQAEMDRLEEDIGGLEEALKAQGRSRDNGERARDNVRKAIEKVGRSLWKGGTAEQAFARHTEQFVDRGFECIYNYDGQPWR